MRLFIFIWNWLQNETIYTDQDVFQISQDINDIFRSKKKVLAIASKSTHKVKGEIILIEKFTKSLTIKKKFPRATECGSKE